MISLKTSNRTWKVQIPINNCTECATYAGTLTSIRSCDVHDLTVLITADPCNINYHVLQVSIEDPYFTPEGDYVMSISCESGIIYTEEVRFTKPNDCLPL